MQTQTFIACVDCTAIAQFDSWEEAKNWYDLLPDPAQIEMRKTSGELISVTNVAKMDIAIMDEDSFNLL